MWFLFIPLKKTWRIMIVEVFVITVDVLVTLENFNTLLVFIYLLIFEIWGFIFFIFLRHFFIFFFGGGGGGFVIYMLVGFEFLSNLLVIYLFLKVGFYEFFYFFKHFFIFGRFWVLGFMDFNHFSCARKSWIWTPFGYIDVWI